MYKKSTKFALLIISLITTISLVAAACGSDSDDDNVSTAPAAPAEPGAPAAGGSSDIAPGAPVDPAGEVATYTYEELLEITQTGFDRSHPFQSLDSFCTTQPAPTVALQATDPGITESEITLVHIRSKLEEFEAIGFATNVGDPKEMFEDFVQIVNERCGGVNGRQIKLVTLEVSVAGENVDDLRNAACIEATEDNNGVIVMNSTGFQGSGGLCLAERSIFISTQGQTQEFMDSGQGNLLSLSPTLENSINYLIDYLLGTGELVGKTVGVIAPDTPGQAEAAQLIQEKLQENDIDVPVFDIIGCNGGTSCNDGVTESVRNLVDNDVDVLFPTLNVVSLPGYIGEMSTQGFEPGDIAFYNSDFNSQAGDLVSSKIVLFGGEDSGTLYNGAIIVDDARTGAFREAGFVETPFNKMCADEYESISGVTWNFADADENSPYGMVATVCAELRMALRAIYDAGPNPTRAGIQEAILNLGQVDLNNMLPGSFAPSKWEAPDAIHTTVFTYPCAQAGTGTDQNTCILSQPDDRWRFVN